MKEKLPDPHDIIKQDLEDTALVRTIEEHGGKLRESIESALRLSDLRKEQIKSYFREGAVKGSSEAKLIVAAIRALGEMD